MREYVVLRRHGNGRVETDESPWLMVTRVSAGSADSAIRKAAKLARDNHGVTDYVAVPARGWHERRVEKVGWKYTQESVTDLYHAAQAAARKLRVEYHNIDPEAPETESWAEGERLEESLWRFDEQLLSRIFGVDE